MRSTRPVESAKLAERTKRYVNCNTWAVLGKYAERPRTIGCLPGWTRIQTPIFPFALELDAIHQGTQEKHRWPRWIGYASTWKQEPEKKKPGWLNSNQPGL